jgi:hypothetical protein
MSNSTPLTLVLIFAALTAAGVWISSHLSGSTDRTVKATVRFVYGLIRPDRVDPEVQDVSDVAVNVSQWRGRAVALRGIARSVERTEKSLRFRVEREGRGISVSYQGAVPSELKEDAEVLVQGVIEGDELSATAVMVRM